MIGYQTPNIDRIANEGAIFTNVCAQQSCTAGRAAFILGQSPFRTGLLTIGVPGSPQGTPIERSHSPPTKVASIPPIESRWLGRSSSISGPTLRVGPARFRGVCSVVRRPVVAVRADTRQDRGVRRDAKGVSTRHGRIAQRRSELQGRADSECGRPTREPIDVTQLTPLTKVHRRATGACRWASSALGSRTSLSA